MFRPLALIAGLTLTAAFAAPVLLSSDYSTLPPTASEVHAVLTSGAKLTTQIAVAEQATGGIASNARINPADGSTLVTVYTSDKRFDLLLNNLGTVTSKTEVHRFPGDPVTGEWTETGSGLKYWDIKVGEGTTPPSSSSKVLVHYTGWLLDGKKFDSSLDRGKPIDFPLNGVIPGWTEGVGSMRVGGKRKLIIPAKLAYGRGGRPGIPGNATLVFDVELIKVL